MLQSWFFNLGHKRIAMLCVILLDHTRFWSKTVFFSFLVTVNSSRDCTAIKSCKNHHHSSFMRLLDYDQDYSWKWSSSLPACCLLLTCMQCWFQLKLAQSLIFEFNFLLFYNVFYHSGNCSTMKCSNCHQTLILNKS